MRGFLVRSAASTIAVAAAISVPTLAKAQSRSFNVPAQSASQGIREFARQAGIQVTLAGRDGEGRRTNTVRGTLEVRDALDQLLRGSGLVIRAFDGEAAVIAAATGRMSAESGEFGGEVVVTAQKITERLIDVPISVSAFTAQDLSDQKIEGGPELLRGIPNVSFSKDNFSGYNFTIRGIGTKAISTTADPAVAISFNYTPLIRNRLFEQEYFDVERVEVLRGPQGTLYGRNATAGVVNMLPAKPRLGRWAGEVQGEVGNYETTRLRGFLNVPIGDTLAVRAAGAWTKREGFDFNTVSQKNVNGRDLYSIRLSALWEPDPRLRFSFFWEHFNEDDDRSRTGKQLCTRGETPKTVDYADQNGVARSMPVGTAWTIGTITPGCQNKTLFSDEAYGVPNGLGFPIVTPLILATPGGSSQGPHGGNYWTNLFLDPFGTSNGRQSRNLREMGTFYDPVYRARNDLFQFNAEFDVTDDLHFTSQTLYMKDRYTASQDFFRFEAAPYFTPPEAYVPGPIVAQWRPYLGSRNGLGTFKDPQLGELTVPAAVDLSQANSEQWSQEVRLNSSFEGPINFNVGANYLSYKTTENYYVFSNLFTAAALVDRSLTCDSSGEGCLYIDPNPIGSINGEGHNYYRNIQDLKTRSWAAFGEVYWKPTSNVKVTAGLRYTDDRKRIALYPTQLLSSTTGYSGGTVDRGYPLESLETRQWRRLTGRLAIDWKPRLSFTDETMLYASYARGYKGGGNNPIGQRARPCPTEGPPPAYVCATYTQLPTNFEPEEVNSFEIGMKNKIAGGKLMFNLSAFYNNYKNYQISQLIDRMVRTENFDAISYGVEMEAAWIPSRHFKVGATLGYLRTRLGSGQSSIDVMDRLQGNNDWIIIHPWAQSPNSCIAPKQLVGEYIRVVDLPGLNRNPPRTTGAIAVKKFCEASSLIGGGTGFKRPQFPFTYNPLAPYDPSRPADYFSSNPSNYGAPNQGRGFSADVSGNQLPNAPRFTFNVGAEYTFFLDDWRLSLRGDYYRQSSSYARIYNTDYDRLRGWGNANAAITLSRPESNLTYQLYVKNLFDSTPITDAFTGPDELGNFSNVFTLDPRIVGFSVRVGFK